MKITYHSIVLLLMVGSCFQKETKENEDSKKPYVVATTGMLYDAVINIAGNKADVDFIMGPGVDPHLYKATQGDLSKFNNADLIIYNGLLLEGKMGDILAKLSKQKPVLAAASFVPKSQLKSASKYENVYDPHVWFDIQRWKYAVTAITDGLSTMDSLNASHYQQNTEKYLIQLDSLDAFVKKSLLRIPKSQRILITAHDAFTYFGDAYGIQVEGLQGISTVADFGLKDIANIIDLIIENKVKAIFVETSVSEKSINAVVTGCKEKGHDVAIGGYLYADAMGEPGTEEGTYIGMFKHNVETIVNALK